LIQECVAFALQVKQNQVSASVKRIGGGFGGKGPKSTWPAVAAAVAAKIMKKRVRLEVPLRDSIQIIGARPEYIYKYKSYFDASGKIKALDFTQFADAGAMNNDSKLFNGPFLVGFTGNGK